MSANDFHNVEAYLFADDKQQFINNLIPGSEAYFFFTFLHLLKNSDSLSKEAELQLQEYEKNWKNSAPLNKIKIMHLLKKFDHKDTTDKDKEAILKSLNDSFLHQSWNHSKPSHVSSSTLQRDEKAISSKLDEKKLFGFENQLERVYTDSNGINSFYTPMYPKFDVERMFKNPYTTTIETWLIGLDAHEIKDYVSLVVRYVEKVTKKNESPRVSSYILQKLTLAQLKELGTKLPDLYKDQSFVYEMFYREFKIAKGQTIGQGKTKEERRELLLKVYDWSKELPLVTQSISLEALDEILQLGIHTNKFSKDLFLEYLKRPGRAYSMVNSKYYEKLAYSRNMLRWTFFNKGEWINEQELIKTYLSEIFKTAENYQPYDEYLDHNWLKELFWTTKLLKGETVSDLSNSISADKLKNLSDSKEMTVCKYNKEYFKGNEPVNIFVEMKNIPNLLVKVFEFNPENYYLKENRELDGTINLDGLIATEEHNFEFKEPPVQKFTKEFSFESISKKRTGIFIIDFIGNGLSTRVIIRKGKLTFLEHQTVAGQLFEIVDDEKNICKGERTGMWLEGKFYKTNDQGRIIVPFSHNHRTQAVIVHEEFAERVDIDLKGESYSFTCTYIYTHESFLMGNKAKVLAQPRLFINDRPIGLDIIKTCSAVVTTYTDLNIPVNTNFDKLKPTAFEDIELEFPIPAKLAKVDITIKASIPKVDSSEDFKFTSTHSIYFNLHMNKMDFTQLYLKNSFDGYRIYVLGKNGEPKAKMNLSLYFTHKHINTLVGETLATDSDGSIFLGKLSDCTRISATLQASGDIQGFSQQWEINSTKSLSYPDRVYLVEGEEIVFPLNHSELNGSKIRFLETLETGEPLTNLLSTLTVDQGKLFVKGLKVGSYQLVLRDVSTTINIQVLEGKKWDHNKQFVITNKALYNVRNQVNNIVIEEVQCVPREDNENCNLVIHAYADDVKLARFHVFACQFLANNIDKTINELNVNKGRSSFQAIPTELRKTLTLNNRKLGDEYVYVLDRKNKTRYVGNTLEKPQVLLKRTFVRDTTSRQEELADNQNFEMDRNQECEEKEYKMREEAMLCDIDDRRMNARRASPGQGGGSTGSDQGESFLNFLSNSALIHSNLKLNEKGEILIENFPASQYSHIQIIASNLTSNIQKIFPLPHTKVPVKDLSLKSQMKKDSFYSINRGSSKVSKGKKVEIKDLTSTDIQVVDSVSKLFEIQKALILCENSDSENGGYEFWSFIKEWHTYSTDDKLKKYDKFASHELNIFIYLRDPTFFADVVSGFLRNKIEKTLVDYCLVEDEKQVLKAVQPGNIDKISNNLESVLAIHVLSKNHKEQAKALAARLENKGKSFKVMTNQFKRLFDTVLNSKTQEESAKFKPTVSTSTTSNVAAGSSNAPRIQQSMMNMNRAMPMSNMNMNMMVQNIAPSNAQFSLGAAMPEPKKDSYGIRSKEAFSNDDDFAGSPRNDYGGGEFLQARSAIRGGFKELEKTKEYCERNYYGKTYSPGFNSANPFWVDLAKHLVEHGAKVPFLTQNFIHAASCHTEMLGVISFFGVAFKPDDYISTPTEGRGLIIEATSDSIVFTKEISEGKADLKPEILVSQRFFDPKERYMESEEDPGVQIEKEVEQYVINKIYGCKVTVTNCSVASQEVQVLVEIPEGSIPVYLIDYTKSHTITLPSTGNSTLENYFYFPSVGKYKVYPSNVSKNGKVMAMAVEKEFDVSESRKYTSLESFTAILSQGSEEDILNFMRTKNIFDPKVLNMTEVWWLLKKKEFYLKFIEILRERKFFDSTTWTYSILHNDFKSFAELMDTGIGNGLANNINYLQTSLLKVDKIKVLEYNPYVNSRVHLLSSEKNQILNVEFKDQYQNFVRYLAEVPALKVQHYITLVYYLLLQDRIDDAIKFFNKINAEEVAKNEEHQLQYDYFAAYLDFYIGYPKFAVAREVCLKYLGYPVLSWRSLFIDIANQLAEFDGDEMIEDEMVKANEKKSNSKNAEKEEIISMELEGTKLNITYQNIKEIIVYFYKVDLEILFSRNPFLSQNKDEFAFIKPSHSHKVTIKNTDLEKVQYEIPPDLQKANVFIQLRTDNKTLSATYFPTSLRTQIIENYGQIKVTDNEDKPLTKVYVKCFVKTKDGRTSFYKDGYTDLRGRFDYATLNSGDVSNIDKFALLVISDEHGSLTKEATAPSKLGRVENNLVLKTKNVKYQQAYEEQSQKYAQKKK